MSLPRMSAALPLALALAVTGCGSDDAPTAGDTRPAVTAAIYPYAFLVERIGGDDVALTTLTPAGAEPHDLELTPRQVAALAEADLVVHAEGFQPAVDEAVEQQAPEAGFAIEPVDGDPHLWLDPVRLAEVAQRLADRLAELDPENAVAYEQRGGELVVDLKSLDADLTTGLETCERRDIVTSHAAFGLLAERYDLEQIAVTGITPEEEPTPGRLAEVARLAEERGVTTVFFEELVSPRTAESLAREVGAKAEVLSPLEGAPESGDYLTAMRANLQTLRTALGCS